MPDDPRVQELLDRLSDSDATPEEVCGSCVELLPVVRERWRQMRQAREELDALFPPEGESDPAAAASWPEVPGYEIEAVLGRGGMGIVYRARHIRLKRVIALKMILAGGRSGPRERERFRREAEAVAAMRHPNVVQVHDIGDAGGRPYFTMEYVEGGSLAQKLAGAPLASRDAASLVAALAGAVEAAHRNGIVHRDLKPANVLLTANGVPKVSDFGLARRLDGEAGLTRTGTAVGTPSYMAPEHAGENKSPPGPPADIYSLGAILYELLTGRPPFQAGNAAVTIYRAVTQDPVRPSRLNARVPQDLETICLKCLVKDPRLRYQSAAGLEEDLRRFLDGEAIAARPEGPVARLARRVRRRPVLSAAVAVATLSTLALTGGGAWTYSEREATRRAATADQEAVERAADADLTEMEDHLRKSSWPAARAAWERARGRLGDGGADYLRTRSDQGAGDLRLAERLHRIRLNRAAGVKTVAHAEYQAAFREAGLYSPGEPPAGVAERVRASNIRRALTDAVDHWAVVASYPGHNEGQFVSWLLGVAGAADPDADEWCKRFRDPAVRGDNQALLALAESADVDHAPVNMLVALGELLHKHGGNAVPFLKKVQRRHPNDLWANFTLGYVATNSADGTRYFQAALAIRPESAVIYHNLGFCAYWARRYDEAVDYYTEAVNRDPRQAEFHAGLAASLLHVGRVLEAAGHIREGLVLKPNPITAGHLRNAEREVLVRQGRWEEARAAWAMALAGDPPGHHDWWYGYAELCLFLGREDDYRRARSDLLAKFGGTTDPQVAERTARAALLLPASGVELLRATALAERAATADRATYAVVQPAFQFVRGLAEYRQGRYESAIAVLRGEPMRLSSPPPRLVLAMAMHKSGREAEARKTLAAAILGHDWRADNVKDQDGWICHVLRREAEGLILPNLTALLEGKQQPRDNDERLGLLGACQSDNRTLALARQYADAFDADPKLADDFRAGRRSIAAVSAVLAGCGQGKDTAGLGDAERSKWRTQAREWLRADLAAWETAIQGNPVTHRDAAWQRLRQWANDPDLVWVRRPDLLDKLPAGERKDWTELWSDVDAMLRRTASGR